MESKSVLQGWLQTLAIIATILGAVGFFWLNVASKDDINLLRDEMNRQLAEIRTDIKQLDQDYKNHRLMSKESAKRF